MQTDKGPGHRGVRPAVDTYAREAGIRLRNQPMPLFQLLMLCLLAGNPIDATTAARAARELFKIGLRTPHKVLRADRHIVIDALGRARYRRYDESSATGLIDLAQAVVDEYRGDLRMLAERSGRDIETAAALLKAFNGIGDTGAKIFLHEVQEAWPWTRSTSDGLLGHATELAGLAPIRDDKLAAALKRFSADADIRPVDRTHHPNRR